MRRDIAFDADGVTLRGWLFVPDGKPAKRPMIVMSPGFTAVKEQHSEEYAEVFAAAGFCVLLFDNRNFGASDGLPRQEADPFRQVWDIRHAITFASTLLEVDRDRIGYWGSSYSGGHALMLAAIDRRVKCVVSSVPAVSGYEGARRRIHPDRWDVILASYQADREARFAGAAPVTVPVVSEDPNARCSMPGLEAWEAMAGKDAPDAPAWINEVTIASGEMSMAFEPGVYIERISPTPLLMIVATHDKHVPSDLALRAYERALEPKKLFLFSGGHFDVYTKGFQATSTVARDWFLQHL